MKIATWNVNGIRARASQLQEWLEQERPDVMCLQELKAELSQIPEVCRHPDYHAYWHTLKGYSGVSLQVRKELVPADPVYSHPPFDMESRIVQVDHGDLVIASIYVPNGGKDYASKLSFLTQLTDWTRKLMAEGREVLLCGDMNIARTDLDVHPRERNSTRSGSDRMSVRCSRDYSGLAWWIWDAPSIRKILVCSPGGRRGETSARGISAGVWITCWPLRHSHHGPRLAWSGRKSGPVIMRR